jgi:hypothetical protein
MADHINNLTPAQLERLALLLEEMGEAQQLIGKILRHGYWSFNPNDEDETPNHLLLEKELGDVLSALDRMAAAKDIDTLRVDHHRARKHEKVRRYLHYQEDADSWRADDLRSTSTTAARHHGDKHEQG